MTVGIALYGLGTVGSGLHRILAARKDRLDKRHGLDLELRHIVVRDPARPRAVAVDPALLSADLDAPLDDPAVDVVVEVMGGIEPAGTVVRRALEAGKHVVTANKALIAAQGEELERLAEEHGATLRYEAAVGGAIPILHALRGALVANEIRRIRGIVNGTTNYILTRMARDGTSLAEALERAQALGFAEADPSADLSGTDAAQKLIILARHAFGTWVPESTVARQGIEDVTTREIEDAARGGGSLKLVAEAALGDDGTPSLRVAPTVLDADDPLAGIHDEMNAVVVDGDFAGPLLFAGRGAGAGPTGSAVYADLVEVAGIRRHVASGG